MLKNIEIYDYKCFKNFRLDGLSQINIISGGNNVGKTALLEALFIEREVDYHDWIGLNKIIPPFITISNNRDISHTKFSNYLKKIKFSTKSNNKEINIIYKSTYSLNEVEKETVVHFNQDYNGFLVSKVDGNLDLTPIDDIDMSFIPTNYINSSKPQNNMLVQLYSKIQTKGIQHKFLNYLKVIDENIEWIEPQLVDNELFLRINLNNPEHSLISSELGEGTNRYIEILATLLSESNGSMFIDEIENGIHYSKLKDICKVIIEVVKKENIQLFVTTHDEETIKAFIQASEELNYKDISSIHLFKNEKNKIEAIVREHENFTYGINRGADVR